MRFEGNCYYQHRSDRFSMETPHFLSEIHALQAIGLIKENNIAKCKDIPGPSA